jgi:hypothetical protein
MRKQLKLEQMRSNLKPGMVYRRSEFTSMSSNVDRNLARLVREGHLKKLQNGLYFCPKKTTFGEGLPDEKVLLTKFLNDEHFVVYGPSIFNTLGLGTTQLYNRKVVFNRKRNGEMELGGRRYFFHKWREAPKNLSKEFLLVEMMNRLNDLSEYKGDIMKRLKSRLFDFNIKKLKYALSHYGTLSAQKRLGPLISKEAF